MGVNVKFLGAASVKINIKGEHQTNTMVFSDDLGICYNPILFPPTLIPKADVIWIESNYGDRIQPLVKASEELKTAILDTFDRYDLVIIPEFSVSRTKLIMMYYLFQLMEKGQISKVLIFVDSPMATSVTKLYQDFRNDHQLSALPDEVDHNLFQHPQFHYYQKTRPIPWQCYNLSAEGIITGGGVVHHLSHHLHHERNGVIFFGFHAEGTRWRRLVDG